MMRQDLGYAQVQYVHDKFGNTTSAKYMDVNGNPATWKERGYSAYENVYDEAGNWVESRYYDEQGNLTLRKDEGYAIIRNEYDEYGQRIAEHFYAAKEPLEPIESSKYHCVGFKYEYNERGERKNTERIVLGDT